MEGLFRTLLPDNLDSLAGILDNAVMAAIFLVVGFWAAGFVSKQIRSFASRNERIDDTLAGFFASLARYAILTFVVIAVLQRFGFPATSLVAVLGAATLAIGFALQGALGNFAAGVMVAFFRPYKLGDFVTIAGHSGSVRDITLFSTELATVDNVQIIVPNGEAWSGAIVNFSAHDKRRVDLTFGIGYGDDIQKATDVILAVVGADQRFVSEPAAPWVRVVNLADSSVELQLRAWVASSDYWEARFQTVRAVKEAFDREGIEIPYPHQVEIEKTVGAAA